VTTYYHWIDRGIDFISMDNASADMFDPAEMTWFKMVLANDAKSSAIRTVVLGMHAALPDSSSAGHSMNSSVRGQSSGKGSLRRAVRIPEDDQEECVRAGQPLALSS
jgi:hypothetical protein